MNRIFVFRSISIVCMLVLFTACSQATETPTSTPLAIEPQTSTEAPLATESPAVVTEAPAATEAPVTSEGGMPVAGAGQCANAYYPVREGATWTYNSTGSPEGNYSYTETLKSVSDTGFVLERQFDQVTGTQEWSCTSEGLVALQLGGGTLITNSLKLVIESQNVSGVIYPPEIQDGDQWDYALDFTGTMNITGTAGAAAGSNKNHFTALGVESVTVPAGTFDAMKIQVDTNFEANVELQGLKVPFNLTSTYYYWYAQGVGWVKAEGSGSVAGQTFKETLELQSYNIP